MRRPLAEPTPWPPGYPHTPRCKAILQFASNLPTNSSSASAMRLWTEQIVRCRQRSYARHSSVPCPPHSSGQPRGSVGLPMLRRDHSGASLPAGNAPSLLRFCPDEGATGEAPGDPNLGSSGWRMEEGRPRHRAKRNFILTIVRSGALRSPPTSGYSAALKAKQRGTLGEGSGGLIAGGCDAWMTRMDNHLLSRNVTIDGFRTSLRLEKVSWDALEDICRSEGLTTHQLCSMVEPLRNGASRTSAIRTFIVSYYRAAATESGPLRAGTLAQVIPPRGAVG